MDRKKLAAAVAEAKRFISRANDLRGRYEKGDLYEFQGSRESGYVRRASMDLTRALADLRRPGA